MRTPARPSGRDVQARWGVALDLGVPVGAREPMAACAHTSAGRGGGVDATVCRMNTAGPARWLYATRPKFLTAIALPVLLGTTVAWWGGSPVDLVRLVLALAAALLAHAGANVLNDYYDHLSGADEANTRPLTPFAGGSRMIQRGLIDARQTRALGVGLLVASCTVGLLLVWLTVPLLLAVGVLGVAIGWAYTAPPLRLCYRGLGEVAVALDFGLLAVSGAFLVQARMLSATAVVASLPVGLLVAAILLANEFPDCATDAGAGKRTLVVRLGTRAAMRVYAGLLLAAAATLLAGVLAGLLPVTCLIALLAAPLGVRAWRTLLAFPPGHAALLPALRGTIALHGTACVLLMGGFLANRLTAW